jgi:catechol 2,3-dioxygenase-like lactoylglutathione lyase family enzyme
MRVLFVAGFASIVPDLQASRKFYADDLGIPLSDDDYPATGKLEGVKHFGLWSLSAAAQACFGTDRWPADVPVPQGVIEFEVDDVATAAAELVERGHHLLVDPHLEPWGQTTARLLSPEGLLVGICYTPWFRQGDETSSEHAT